MPHDIEAEPVGRMAQTPHFFFYTYVTVAFYVFIGAYSLFFSSLSKLPGRWLSKISVLPLYKITHSGQEASVLAAQHAAHGPVVRLSPLEVSIADGRALQQIYVQKGGFAKPKYYRNFDVDGHATIFSETDHEKRASRAKAVMGMFSLGAIRKEGWDSLHDVADRWVRTLIRAKEASLAASVDESERKLNLLKGTRSLAIDAVTSYLMGERYGALDETLLPGQMSAAAFVDEYVAVGRFFYLPTWLFSWVEWASYRLNKNKDRVDKSMKVVDDFVHSVVVRANPRDESENTYQARLLRAGISPKETIAQCKDLMFAGTDSSGMNLATICWYLTKFPEKRKHLRDELLANPSVDPLTLPYLSGVVKEGLRLSMANPTRLPRVVPRSGFTLPTGQRLPPGTIIGASPNSMHFNPEVFPSPMEFLPERWSSPTQEMLRDYMPFGLGSRACIARNLATVELHIAVETLVRRDVLEGARCVAERIEIIEWFNSKVVGEKIEIAWGK